MLIDFIGDKSTVAKQIANTIILAMLLATIPNELSVESSIQLGN